MNPRYRQGLQIYLPQDENEQEFANSLSIYSSSWLRIKIGKNEIYTDDRFRGMTGIFYSQHNKILFRIDHF